jgi:hypothetical protein
VPVDFTGLFSVLSAAGVRFVVVGGLAMLLHGFDRLTADVDLVIDLASDAARSAVEALTKAGYRPLAPVDPAAFADAARREQWRRETGMQVFSLWDTTNARPTVDLLLQSPVPFEELWRDSSLVTLSGLSVRIASAAHLIRMKQASGRPQDLLDVERLRTKLPARR